MSDSNQPGSNSYISLTDENIEIILFDFNTKDSLIDGLGSASAPSTIDPSANNPSGNDPSGNDPSGNDPSGNDPSGNQITYTGQNYDPPYFQPDMFQVDYLQLDQINDNAGATDTLVIELGDTHIRRDQFYKPIPNVGSVIQMSQSHDDFKTAFDCKSSSGSDKSISENLSNAFRPYDASNNSPQIAQATDLKVYRAKDSVQIQSGLPYVIARLVKLPLDQIGASNTNDVFANWIIPTLFEGKIYNVVSAVRNDDVSGGIGVAGNVGSAHTNYYTKDEYIKLSLKNMGIIDGSNNWIQRDSSGYDVNGNQRDFRVIFRARLLNVDEHYVKTDPIDTSLP